MPLTDVSVAILAGGRSRRMGTDKSLLPFAGKPLIAHVIGQTALLGLPTLLVSNTPEQHEPFHLPMVQDVYPGQGSLGGIYTALAYSRTAYTLCVACDMPFLNADLLRYLIEQRLGYDAVVPVVDGQYESLHAVYCHTCLEPIEHNISVGNLRIQDLFGQLRTREVGTKEIDPFDRERRSFMNLNTPADVAQISERFENVS